MRKGFTLIEIQIALFVFVAFIGAALSLFFTSSSAINIHVDQVKASQYANEGIAIIRSIKYDSFLNLQDGSYVLSRTGDDYSLTTGTETLDGIYDRTVEIEPVYRDTSGDIDDSGTVLDTLMKKVSVTVAWSSPLSGAHTVTISQYLSDWEGTTWTQTTETEFDDGTLNNVSVAASGGSLADDGEITLASIVGDFSYLGSGNVGAHANDTFYANGILYAAVDKTNEGLCTVDVSDPMNPVELDCVDVDGKGLAVEVSGNYAYVGTDDWNDGLSIVNISDPDNLVFIRSLNLSDIVEDLVIEGGYLYAAVDHSSKSLTVVDLFNPSNPIIASTRHAYNADGEAIEVNGNYAYVTNDDEELVIFDISNPYNPDRLSRESIENDGLAITYKDSFVYIAVNDSNDGLEVVNVSDPYNPVSVANYDVGQTGRGVAIVDDALLVAVNSTNNGAQIYDISNPSSLSLETTLDINGKGLKSFATDDYIYVAVDVNNQGVAIVSVGLLGGGGGGVEQSGDFISYILDTENTNNIYDSISWEANVPPGSTLGFQIRTADTIDNLIGNPGPPEFTEATFVGPDGTDATFYTTSPDSIALDPSSTGNRYLQWKAFFDKGSSTSPTLYDVTIKYEN
jgi:type II secretory pathway pseudopilin PulG